MIDVEDGSLNEIDTRPQVRVYVVITRPSVLSLIDCELFRGQRNFLRVTAGILRYLTKLRKVTEVGNCLRKNFSNRSATCSR